jgi:hypothetical protein
MTIRQKFSMGTSFLNKIFVVVKKSYLTALFIGFRSEYRTICAVQLLLSICTLFGMIDHFLGKSGKFRILWSILGFEEFKKTGLSH